MKVDDLTQKIIGCAYKVHNALGQAFLRKFTRTYFGLRDQLLSSIL